MGNIVAWVVSIVLSLEISFLLVHFISEYKKHNSYMAFCKKEMDKIRKITHYKNTIGREKDNVILFRIEK